MFSTISFVSASCSEMPLGDTVRITFWNLRAPTRAWQWGDTRHLCKLTRVFTPPHWQESSRLCMACHPLGPLLQRLLLYGWESRAWRSGVPCIEHPWNLFTLLPCTWERTDPTSPSTSPSSLCCDRHSSAPSHVPGVGAGSSSCPAGRQLPPQHRGRDQPASCTPPSFWEQHSPSLGFRAGTRMLPGVQGLGSELALLHPSTAGPQGQLSPWPRSCGWQQQPCLLLWVFLPASCLDT